MDRHQWQRSRASPKACHHTIEHSLPLRVPLKRARLRVLPPPCSASGAGHVAPLPSGSTRGRCSGDGDTCCSAYVEAEVVSYGGSERRRQRRVDDRERTLVCPRDDERAGTRWCAAKHVWNEPPPPSGEPWRRTFTEGRVARAVEPIARARKSIQHGAALGGSRGCTSRASSAFWARRYPGAAHA